jgi:hypothetical protein
MHQPLDTRGDPVADQIFQNVDGVLAIEGNKEAEVVEAGTQCGAVNNFARGDCDKEAQQQGVVMPATYSPKVSAPSAFAHPDPRSMRP